MLFNKACAWGPWYRKDVELLERVMKMIKQLEHFSCEEGLRESGLFSLAFQPSSTVTQLKKLALFAIVYTAGTAFIFLQILPFCTRPAQ